MPPRTFCIWLAFAIGAGALLRLWMISEQILVDDEWHGLNWVAAKSFWEVLTGFDPKENSSPPLNLYRLALLQTIGWSETALRLPSLLAGIVTVGLLPWLARREVGARAALLFSWLLAISPLLVFYSRFSKAYSLFALVGLLYLHATVRWSRSGGWPYGALIVLLGALSAYIHLWGLIVALVPLAVLAAAKLRQGRSRSLPQSGSSPPSPSWAEFGLVCGALVLLLTLLLFPALRRAADLPWAAGTPSTASFVEAALMLGGTASLSATVALMAFGLVGARFLMRRDPEFGGVILVTGGAYVLAILFARPSGSEHALVLLRYAMPMVPAALLLVAVGGNCLLQSLEDRLDARRGGPLASAGLVAAALVGLLLAGPWREIYTSPNNFTNHSAFQGSYRRLSWQRSSPRHLLPGYPLRQSEVPEFYQWLGPSDSPIVEYPLDITNYNNRLYYFQHFHRRPVLAGYTTDPRRFGHGYEPLGGVGTDPVPPGTPSTVGWLLADEILSRVEKKSQLDFKNMVDLDDPDAIVREGASHLVIHKRMEALLILPERFTNVNVHFKSSALLSEHYRRLWGDPVFEDDRVVVFRIPSIDARDPGL